MTVDFPALAERFLRAQLDGDRREALRIAIEDGVGGGARVVDVQARVVAAAQEEIGRLWQANRITIAQEHLATGISQIVLARLFDHTPPAVRNGKLIVVACVAGELHDLPARLVADFLDSAGFTVRYYGANVPADHLVRELAEPRPALLALSATMSFHAPALREAVTKVRAAYPDLPILIGGHAVRWAPELPEQLGVETAPSPPDDLISAVMRLTETS